MTRDFPHLPTGREPGGQSIRNRRQRNFWGPVAGLVGTAMFAAGIWVAAGGRGARFDRQEELWGGLFFAAIGLLCVYGGFVMWERGRPKRHPRLRGTTLAVDGGSLRRGEAVSVACIRGQPNDRLEVGIACEERYDVQVRVYMRPASMVRRQTAQATIYEQWQSVPPGGAGEHAFTFHVPIDAPYSYEGDCVSYVWRISARAPARLRKDARTDEPIWVEP